jgi:hypothetical protein
MLLGFVLMSDYDVAHEECDSVARIEAGLQWQTKWQYATLVERHGLCWWRGPCLRTRCRPVGIGL